MKLADRDFSVLCELAKQAAQGAGLIIQDASGGSVDIKKKEAGENIASRVVTEVDLKAQEFILATLNSSLKEYDLGLLAEEGADDKSRLEKDYYWCVDPLDGTLAFSRKEDGYSTSIALVSKAGEAVIGVVYNPKTQNLYSAIKGHGAYKNDENFILPTASKNLTLLYDQSFLKIENYEQEIAMLKVLAKQMKLEDLTLHPLGGAVMNAITTIELNPALYYKHPKKALGGGSIWDFAASSIIQSEAGGFNSNYAGMPLKLNDSESTFMNHQGVKFASSKDIIEIMERLRDIN